MPRYFFDIRYDNEPWSPDEEGTELVSRGHARAEALELVASLAAKQVRKRWRIAIRVREAGSGPFVRVSLSVEAEPPE